MAMHGPSRSPVRLTCRWFSFLMGHVAISDSDVESRRVKVAAAGLDADENHEFVWENG